MLHDAVTKINQADDTINGLTIGSHPGCMDRELAVC